MPVPGDFDGDGRMDFAVYRPGSGYWFVQYSNGKPWIAQQWGALNDKPVIGDFSGTGSANLSIWRPSTGTWWVAGLANQFQWGLPNDTPVGQVVTAAP